jgi:integrase
VPKTALTEITLRNLKPPVSGQTTIWDALPGFGVRVSQGGTKTFIVLLRSGRRRAIGRYPVLTLSDARQEAKRLLAEYALGREQLESIVFEKAVPIFLDSQYQSKSERSRRDTERLLNRHFLPKFRGEKLTAITTARVAGVLDNMASIPSEQRHAFTAIGTLIRWAIPRGYMIFNPCAAIKFKKIPPRTRVLSDNELKAIWSATPDNYAFHHIVRLCVLLGQRRGEIGLLRAEYIDWKARTITLPPEIVKNRRRHSFPFGELAAEILRKLPEEGYLFPSTKADSQVFCGWLYCKRELDKRCPISHWTLHDLRRTFATNLAKLGVAPHVTERLLNHSSGVISGIAAVYNTYSYQKEMRAAVFRWEKQIREIVADGRLKRAA